VQIKDKVFENCDKIINEESEGKLTYWYSEEIQNHVKIASDDGFLMELHKSGHDDNMLDSIYRMLVSMSKSNERSQILRSIRAVVEYIQPITSKSFTFLTKLLERLKSVRSIYWNSWQSRKISAPSRLDHLELY
jgi:hypothetical protein